MGACDSLFREDKKKIIPREDIVNKPKNAGGNYTSAPINNSTTNNDNNQTTVSQMTMEVSQHYDPPKRPNVYQYINKYKNNGLQRSVVKASLVELGQGNSLMVSGIKGSRANQTNSLYTSRADDTGYESSYSQCEMIVDGKMNEELVKNSSDKNTLNNYNEFIGKKDSNSLKNNNNKIMDYYHKKKDLNAIAKENKDKGSDLSIIPSTPKKNFEKQNSKKIPPGIY
jgi:hypothetical protein